MTQNKKKNSNAIYIRVLFFILHIFAYNKKQSYKDILGT